jgi:hypothetical protein
VRDVLVDGVRFHDVQFVDQSKWDGGHPDCLESHGAFVNLTIRNSVFERCGNTFFGLYTDWGSYTGLLIENNLFYKTTENTYWGLQVGTKPGFTCSNVVFRYNTYDPDQPDASNRHAPPLIDDCPGSPTQVYGNIFRKGPPGGGCEGSWSHNVFEEGTPCGAASIVSEAFFVARGSDYHLRPGSPAIGRGDPQRTPARDVDGQARAVDGAPDAGFDEAQGVVSNNMKALMGRAGDELAQTAAQTAALGGALCGQHRFGDGRLHAAVNRLGASISPVRGSVSTDSCSLVVAAAAWGTHLTALRVKALAGVPRDTRFQVIAQPKARVTVALRGTTPSASAFAAAFNAEAENVVAASELLNAFLTSVARAEAAGKARSASWQDKQFSAARTYAKQASALLSREVVLRRSVATALKRADIAGPRLTTADARVAAQIASRGLSRNQRRTLSFLGLRQGEIGTLERRVRNVGSSDLQGVTLAGMLVDPNALARLRSTATALRRLARS